MELLIVNPYERIIVDCKAPNFSHQDTVDGRNPAPVEVLPLFKGFNISHEFLPSTVSHQKKHNDHASSEPG